MRKVLGLSEWQWYALLTLIAAIVAIAGFAVDNTILAAAGTLVLLFCMFGIVYGVLKERSG